MDTLPDSRSVTHLGKLYCHLCLEGTTPNQCAMERLILQLLGLNLRKRDGGTIDFEYHSMLFSKAMEIISDLFGSKISSTHLQNSFNITAPNFIKNLVFEGGPKINPRIVSIDDRY